MKMLLTCRTPQRTVGEYRQKSLRRLIGQWLIGKMFRTTNNDHQQETNKCYLKSHEIPQMIATERSVMLLSA